MSPPAWLTPKHLADQVKTLKTEIADETAQYTRLVLRFVKEAQKVLDLKTTDVEALDNLAKTLVKKLTNFHSLLIQKCQTLENCLHALPEFLQRTQEFQTWYIETGSVVLAQHFAQDIAAFLASVPAPLHGLEELAFAEFYILKECVTVYPTDRYFHEAITGRISSISYMTKRLMKTSVVK